MRVFVCYRREDAAPWAGRLHDALSARFGAANIFQDVEAVRPGESFVEAIDAAVAQADAVLVVIGPRWAAHAEGSAGRLAESDDYVRRELEVGLSSGKRMLPVLVGGTTMPTVGQVPDGLRPIVTRRRWRSTTSHGTRTSKNWPGRLTTAAHLLSDVVAAFWSAASSCCCSRPSG